MEILTSWSSQVHPEAQPSCKLHDHIYAYPSSLTRDIHKFIKYVLFDRKHLNLWGTKEYYYNKLDDGLYTGTRSTELPSPF
jgi:hypothetical protein